MLRLWCVFSSSIFKCTVEIGILSAALAIVHVQFPLPRSKEDVKSRTINNPRTGFQ